MLRAAQHLGMTNKSLATVIGVSEATVSRMRSGDYTLQRGQKSFELAILFLRFYRSLDAIVGGDQEVARTWLKNPNTALDSEPLTLIQTVPGLMNAIHYWTRAALSSSARVLSGLCWRIVEAQHHVSTLKLVDTLDEQRLLEGLIEGTKPMVPPECRHLHYLLFTPFRYGAVYPNGSRFRRAGITEGVFYAAEAVESAIAEMTFHRLLFFAELPRTPWPPNPAEYTAFAAEYKTKKAIDLTRGRFTAHGAVWSDPVDYSQCQALAETARTAAIEIIRYRSVRDPKHGANLASLNLSRL